MKQFHLNRKQDVSGISGTGKVAEGVVFSDGSVAMRWLTDTATTTIFESIADVKEIHGHGDATDIIWDDGKTEKLVKISVGANTSSQETQSSLAPTALFKQLQEVLILCKQVIGAPVSGLGIAREDLGVRRKPKPHNKLPEAH